MWLEKSKIQNVLQIGARARRNEKRIPVDWLAAGFSNAWDALKKLEETSQSDWYEWWFRDIKYKKRKKVFGGLLITSIISMIIITSYLAIKGALTTSSVADLSIMTTWLDYYYCQV